MNRAGRTRRTTTRRAAAGSSDDDEDEETETTRPPPARRSTRPRRAATRPLKRQTSISSYLKKAKKETDDDESDDQDEEDQESSSEDNVKETSKPPRRSKRRRTPPPPDSQDEQDDKTSQDTTSENDDEEEAQEEQQSSSEDDDDEPPRKRSKFVNRPRRSNRKKRTRTKSKSSDSEEEEQASQDPDTGEDTAEDDQQEKSSEDDDVQDSSTKKGAGGRPRRSTRRKRPRTPTSEASPPSGSDEEKESQETSENDIDAGDDKEPENAANDSSRTRRSKRKKLRSPPPSGTPNASEDEDASKQSSRQAKDDQDASPEAETETPKQPIDKTLPASSPTPKDDGGSSDGDDDAEKESTPLPDTDGEVKPDSTKVADTVTEEVLQASKGDKEVDMRESSETRLVSSATIGKQEIQGDKTVVTDRSDTNVEKSSPTNDTISNESNPQHTSIEEQNSAQESAEVESGVKNAVSGHLIQEQDAEISSERKTRNAESDASEDRIRQDNSREEEGLSLAALATACMSRFTAATDAKREDVSVAQPRTGGDSQPDQGIGVGDSAVAAPASAEGSSGPHTATGTGESSAITDKRSPDEKQNQEAEAETSKVETGEQSSGQPHTRIDPSNVGLTGRGSSNHDLDAQLGKANDGIVQTDAQATDVEENKTDDPKSPLLPRTGPEVKGEPETDTIGPEANFAASDDSHEQQGMHVLGDEALKLSGAVSKQSGTVDMPEKSEMKSLNDCASASDTARQHDKLGGESGEKSSSTPNGGEEENNTKLAGKQEQSEKRKETASAETSNEKPSPVDFSTEHLRKGETATNHEVESVTELKSTSAQALMSSGREDDVKPNPDAMVIDEEGELDHEPDSTCELDADTNGDQDRRVEEPPPAPSFSPEFLKTQAGLSNLERLKMRIYLTGARVHRGRGSERRFADYWSALTRYVALRVQDERSNLRLSDGRDAIDSFLTTAKLRKLHNRLILATMERCLHKFVPDYDLRELIPGQWRSRTKRHRVQTKAIEAKSRPREETDAIHKSTPEQEIKSLSSEFRIKSVVFGCFQIGTWREDVWSAGGMGDQAPYGLRDPPSSRIPDPSEASVVSDFAHSSDLSSYLPGALTVDRLVKEACQIKGIGVASNSVWLLVIAVREYTASVLKNTITSIDALASDQILQPPLTSNHILSSAKGGQKKSSGRKTTAKMDTDAASAPLSSPGLPQKSSDGTKTRAITSLDIARSLGSAPSSIGGTLGGSTSRLAYERCMASSFSPGYCSLGFDSVSDFISSEIKKTMLLPRKLESSLGANALVDSTDSKTTATDTAADENEVSLPPPRPNLSRRSSGGLGRGAKNLAALRARSVTKTPAPEESGNDGNAKQSVPNDGPAGEKSPGDAPSNDASSVSPAKPAKVLDENAGALADSTVDSTSISNSANPSEPNAVSPSTRKENGKPSDSSSARVGRGSGVKNLAAMRARTALETDEESKPNDSNPVASSSTTDTTPQNPVQGTEKATESKSETNSPKEAGAATDPSGLGGKQLNLLRMAEERRKTLDGEAASTAEVKQNAAQSVPPELVDPAMPATTQPVVDEPKDTAAGILLAQPVQVQGNSEGAS